MTDPARPSTEARTIAQKLPTWSRCCWAATTAASLPNCADANLSGADLETLLKDLLKRGAPIRMSEYRSARISSTIATKTLSSLSWVSPSRWACGAARDRIVSPFRRRTNGPPATAPQPAPRATETAD